MFSEEEVTSNLRKLLSVWGCFLHASLPDVLMSEEAKATRKSSRRGVAIDGSWVGGKRYSPGTTWLGFTLRVEGQS